MRRKTVNATITPDFTTGQALFQLYVAPTGIGVSPFYSSYVQMGVDVNLNGANVNVAGFIGNAAGAIGNALMGNWLGAVSNIGCAVTDAVADPGRHSSSGGFISIFNATAIIRSIHYPITDADNANQGRP